MVLETESPRVLAHHLDILPSQTCKSFPSYFAEGRGEIDEVNTGEEFFNVDEFGHRFDVPASPASDLCETLYQLHRLRIPLSHVRTQDSELRTHIDPDTLDIVRTLFGGLLHQLSCY